MFMERHPFLEASEVLALKLGLAKNEERACGLVLPRVMQLLQIFHYGTRRLKRGYPSRVRPYPALAHVIRNGLISTPVTDSP